MNVYLGMDFCKYNVSSTIKKKDTTGLFIVKKNKRAQKDNKYL